MKRPNPNFEAGGKQTLEQWHREHEAYKRATGKCSICNRKLQAGDCPSGH